MALLKGYVMEQEGAKGIDKRLLTDCFAEIGDEIILQANDKIDVFCASQTSSQSVVGISSHLKKTHLNL